MGGKAESRLIYSSISTSERIASLGAKGALLYTWLITHCDGQGRMPGKPKVIKQQVVPFIDEISEENIEEALVLMEEQRLILLYADTSGCPLIQILDWWQWQTKLRYRSESHYQAPEGWEDRVTQRDDDGRFVKT
jgi:hypothetical protein